MIDWNSAFFRVWLILAIALYAVLEMFWTGPGPRDGLRWVGFVICLVGLAGVIWARWTLGHAFSVRAKATQLVTSGLYAKIRNPIYVSGLFMMVGLILMVRMTWLWAALALLFVMQILRARKEAAVLEEKFGEEYRRYRARTWF